MWGSGLCISHIINLSLYPPTYTPTYTPYCPYYSPQAGIPTLWGSFEIKNHR